VRLKNSRTTKKILKLAIVALLVLLSPNLFSAAYAQTAEPGTMQGNNQAGGPNQPTNGPGTNGLSPGAQATQATDTTNFDNAAAQVNLITQAAEQDEQQVIQNTNEELLQGTEFGAVNDTYAGMSKFWGDDIIGNLFQNIGQLIGRWVTEFIDGWIADTVHFLTSFLRTFVLNPNIAVNGIQNGPGAGGGDDISPYVRDGADAMYGIAVDLLLLLFILCIWKYWAEAAWRGGAGLFGAVGRLIFTAGLLLAWPTIYAFEVQITNEMINAIWFNSADQVAQLDAAMTAAVKGGLVAGIGLLANAFAPVVGAAAGGIVLGTVGEVVAFAGLVIYLFIGVILITELVYILVLKAIQTGLLTAQYMFAPIFIVFFATPDTESVTAGFVRSFVEVSLWTFVWVGLLKIMVIILYSDYNPWGKIVMAVGILQIMIQVPTFLSRASISPMSDFISAGMLTGGLMKGFSALGAMAQKRSMQAVDYFTNQQFSARGMPQSKKMSANPGSASDPDLVNNLKNRKPGDDKETGGERDPVTGAPIIPPSARGRGDNKEGKDGELGKEVKTDKEKEDEKKKKEKEGVPVPKKDLDASLKDKDKDKNKGKEGGVPGATVGDKGVTTPEGAKEGADGPKLGADGKPEGAEDPSKKGAPAGGAGQGAGETRPLSRREQGRRLANLVAVPAAVGAVMAGLQANQTGASAQSDAEKSARADAEREGKDAQTLNTATAEEKAKESKDGKKDGTEKPNEKDVKPIDDAAKRKAQETAALVQAANLARTQGTGAGTVAGGKDKNDKTGTEEPAAAKLNTDVKDGGTVEKPVAGGPPVNPKSGAAVAKEQAKADIANGKGPLANNKGNVQGTQGNSGNPNGQPLNLASDTTTEGDAEKAAAAKLAAAEGVHSLTARTVVPVTDGKDNKAGEGGKNEGITGGPGSPPGKKPADEQANGGTGAIKTDVKPVTETSKAGVVAGLVNTAAIAKNLPGLAGIKPPTIPAGSATGGAVQGKGPEDKSEAVVEGLHQADPKNLTPTTERTASSISLTQTGGKGPDGKTPDATLTNAAEAKIIGGPPVNTNLAPGGVNATGVGLPSLPGALAGIATAAANRIPGALPQVKHPQVPTNKTGVPGAPGVDKLDGNNTISTESLDVAGNHPGAVSNAQGQQKVIHNLTQGPGAQVPGQVNPSTGNATVDTNNKTGTPSLTPPAAHTPSLTPSVVPTGLPTAVAAIAAAAAMKGIPGVLPQVKSQVPTGKTSVPGAENKQDGGNSNISTEALDVAGNHPSAVTNAQGLQHRVIQNLTQVPSQGSAGTVNPSTGTSSIETNKTGTPSLTPPAAHTPSLTPPVVPTGLPVAAAGIAAAVAMNRIPGALPPVGNMKAPGTQTQQTLHSGNNPVGETTLNQEQAASHVALTGDGAERMIRVNTTGSPDARTVTGVQSQPHASFQPGQSGQPAASTVQSPVLGAAVVPPASLNQTPTPPRVTPNLTAAAQHAGPVGNMARQAMNPIVQASGRLPDQTMAVQEQQNLEAILMQHGYSPERAASIARTGTLSLTGTPTGQPAAAQPGQTPNQSASIPLQSQPAAASATAQSLHAAPPRLGAAATPGPASTPGSARVLGFQTIPGSGGGGGNNGNGTDYQMTGGDGAPPRPGGGRTASGPAPTGFSNFDQDNYRWVPLRNLANDVRTFQGPQQGMSREDDGHGTTTMGAKGISNIKYGKDTTDAQKAMQMMAAGYAQVFTTDPAAYDAARQATIEAGGDAPKGIGQRVAANLLAYNGKSFKQTAIAKQQFTQGLYEQAMTGAEAYVNGGEGNAYTDYLRGRWGAMTSEQQAWGVHIMTDPTSPESGWSTTLQASGDTLTKAGMPINAENRAAASNQTVLRQAQWARGLATRGVAAYSVALAEQQLGPNAHSMERDALVGRIAPGLGSDYVEACRAIMEAAPTADIGAKLCSDPTMVQSVAGTVAQARAQGLDIDANTAYKNLMGPARVMSNRMTGSQTVDVLSGGGGGFSPMTPSSGGSMMPGMAGGVQNDTVIDQTFSNAGFVPTNGSVGHVGTMSSYVPGVGVLGQTTMRPTGGFSSVHAQTSRANMDVHGTVLPSSTPIAAPGSLTAAALGSSTIQSDATIDVSGHITNAGLQQTSQSLSSQSITGNAGSVPGRITTNFVPGRGSGVQNSNLTSSVDVQVQGRADAVPGNVSVPASAMGDSQTSQRIDVLVNAGLTGGAVPNLSGGVPGAAFGNKVTSNFSFIPGQQRGGTVQNLTTEINAPVVTQEMNVGNAGGGVVENSSTMNIQTSVNPTGQSGPVLPSMNMLPNAQEIRQRIRVDVTNAGLSNPSLGQQNFSLNESVQADSRHSSPDFSISGSGSDNSSTYVQQGFAEVFVKQEASAGAQAAYLQNEVNAVGASAANRMGSSMHVAKQIVIDMMSAGFENEHIQNPRIASVAMQISQKDPSMMGTAAIAAKVMNPEEYSVQTVETVQQMVDAGWSGRGITRPDVITSRMVIEQGIGDPQGRPGYGYPEQRLIREIRNIREFVPEMNSMSQEMGMNNRIPENFASEYMNRQNRGNNFGNNGGNKSTGRPNRFSNYGDDNSGDEE
jgi:hypothetical protein